MNDLFLGEPDLKNIVFFATCGELGGYEPGN